MQQILREILLLHLVPHRRDARYREGPVRVRLHEIRRLVNRVHNVHALNGEHDPQRIRGAAVSDDDLKSKMREGMVAR